MDEQNLQRDLLLKIIDDAMEKRDRYVTINFFEAGPMVTVYPLDDEGED